MSVPEIHAKVEARRIMNKLGFASSEFLGASADSLKDPLVIYKTLLDWVRSKSWRLSPEEIDEIESAIREKLPTMLQHTVRSPHHLTIRSSQPLAVPMNSFHIITSTLNSAAKVASANGG